MKPRQSPALQQLPMARRAPVAAAALALLQGVAAAQTPPAPNTTSADVPEARSLFQTGGQESIGPRPFTSFLERLSSPVDKIAIKVAGDNLLADGITATDVLVRLVDRDGQRVRGDIDVTIEVDAGARVQMPGRATAETGADRGATGCRGGSDGDRQRQHPSRQGRRGGCRGAARARARARRRLRGCWRWR